MQKHVCSAFEAVSSRDISSRKCKSTSGFLPCEHKYEAEQKHESYHNKLCLLIGLLMLCLLPADENTDLNLTHVNLIDHFTLIMRHTLLEAH